MRRGTRAVAALAVAVTLVVGACGDGDDDSSSAFTPTGGGDEAGAGGGEPGPAGDDQPFCDWFNSAAASPRDWDPEVTASLTPPAEIAESFEAILGGDTSLSLQSEVTRWVTANCF